MASNFCTLHLFLQFYDNNVCNLSSYMQAVLVFINADWGGVNNGNLSITCVRIPAHTAQALGLLKLESYANMHVSTVKKFNFTKI